MLDKITFSNGTIVSKEYLNEVQKATDFSGSARADFYNATDSEHNSWDISQRDGLKDYEIADPREEGETAIGRLAHDGIVLGYPGTSINQISEATFSEPKTVPVSVSGDVVSIETSEVAQPSAPRGVIIEAGKIILSNGEVFSWNRTLLALVGSTGENYVYVLESGPDISTPQISISTSLPSVASSPHIPLAKLVFSGNEFSRDGDNAVMGTGVIDLRPNLFVGSLNNFSTGQLRNTSIINTSQKIVSGQRGIIDTRNGSVIITLPGNDSNTLATADLATDSDRVAIVDLEGSFDRFPVVLRPGAGAKINGSVDDWVINIRDAHLELFYHQETGEWKFEETPGAECNPKLGTFISCGGKEFIGTRTASECPDGAPIPASYPDPSEGVYRYEASTQKCYKDVGDSVAIYSNGQGGLIKVFAAQRCAKDGAMSVSSINKSIIYVDPSVGNDDIQNTGTDNDAPFRTLERAILEAARASRRREGLDGYDTTVIELAPGDYYIDNSPGVNAVVGASGTDAYIKQVDTGFTALSSWTKDEPYFVIETNDASSTQPPISLNLGRTLYTQSGGIGTIYKIEKLSKASSRWKVYLQYVQGSFAQGDRLLYNRLSDFNPSTGGLIVPRGISINGTDLRKVRVRPMYVPALTPGQNIAQDKKTYIFKVTGGTYISLITFTDNQQFSRTHNTVTAIGFASEEEIKGSDTETSYYQKVASLFAGIDGWGGDTIVPVTGETTIVAPLAASKFNRSQDLEQNQTGIQSPDLDLSAAPSFPGPAILKVDEGGSSSYFKLPDVNSTRSSSPYVFNCSVRSIFGLNGMWVDGSRVAGFKSMVSANYTQVSLQTDPNCFETPTVEYYNDPPTNKQSGEGKKYRSCSSDEFKYRHWGFRSSFDAQVQLVSCFVIGNADHFISETGADLSITNSCSDFGDISLRARGFKQRAFSQDEGVPTGTYLGTKIEEIIPPLPLSYDPLPNGDKPTLVDNVINTGLALDYEKTLEYVEDNSQGEVQPSIFRIYVKNSNTANPFDENNPPQARDIAFGQYSYTKKLEDDTYALTGGDSRANRKQIFITGFDEEAASIIYTIDIKVQSFGAPGFEILDDRSKIFVWDAIKGSWFIEGTTSNVVEEIADATREDKGDINGDGYLTKKLNYAFRYKVTTVTGDAQVDAYKALDFIFDRAPIKIIRGTDQRADTDRVYKVILTGHEKDLGIRRPQSYYVLEKQLGVPGYPLNEGPELVDNPLTVTLTTPFAEYYNVESNSSNDGRYIVYLAKANDARDVFTGDFFPAKDADYPESTEDPDDSITKVALRALQQRSGVFFTQSLAPGLNNIGIKTSTETPNIGFLTSLRRPSVIRASGHTWEWTGYLNYDTSFPTFQGEPLDQDFALGKIIVEETGGRVYATGMNEEGNYYLGTTVFDLRSGEQFSIPLKADNEPGNIANQVLNNVIVKGSLIMGDNSTMVYGLGTKIFFSQDTEFKSLTTGDITANAAEGSRMQVYASTSKAGLVELASPEEVRGARLLGNKGIANQVVVTALDLATEFDVRLDNNLAAGDGILISSKMIDPENDNDGDVGDDIKQFTVGVDPNYPGFTPIGGIIMWNGGTVPTGWALCDGLNGTPNLKDRFVVGAGGGKKQGTSGGPLLQGDTDAHALLRPEIPNHRHGILHEHRNVVLKYNDKHLTDNNTPTNDYDNVESDDNDGSYRDEERDTLPTTIPSSTMLNNDGSRGLNAFSGGASSNDIPGGPVGDGTGGDESPGVGHTHGLSSVQKVEPKWFALAYIMRIS